MNKDLMYETAGTRLANKIVDIFGNEDKATEWYYSSCVALRNKSPYEYCEEGKYSEIEKIIFRMKWGSFS